MKDIAPFQMSLNEIAMFDNAGSQTLFLEPQVNGSSLNDIYQVCKAEFPSHGKGPFVPHIGIAFFRDKKTALALQKQYQEQWKPSHFTIQEIYVMTRIGPTDPFRVHAVIPLGGALLPLMAVPE